MTNPFAVPAVAAVVEVALPLTLDDLTVVVWVAVTNGVTFTQLENVATAHDMIASTTAALGVTGLVQAHAALDTVQPGSNAAALAVAARTRVAELFGPAVAAPSRSQDGAGQ